MMENIHIYFGNRHEEKKMNRKQLKMEMEKIQEIKKI